MRRTPIVILGTVAGLVGVLSFHTTPAHLTIGVLPATSAPRSSPTTSVAAGSPPGPGLPGSKSPSPSTTSSLATTPTTTPAKVPTPSTTPAPVSTSATTSATTPATTAATTPATIATRSANGAAINYNYGVLSVSVTVTGSKITTVGIASLNDGGSNRSQSIDQQSIPILEQEALSAQSANIHGVSGASYTSAGFTRSLQSALTQLGFS
jgi:uncharacterized protein with FMN-binding domain